MAEASADTSAGRRRFVAGSGGIRLAVWERGPVDAPTVVLVHGYPDSHSVWDLVGDRLVSDHRVVVFDVRGAGESDVPSSVDDYRIEHLVEDLRSVIEAVAGQGKVHLVGHDWGSIQCWSAVADPAIASRLASFTSMSGPGLAQVQNWIGTHLRPGGGRWVELAGQGLRSWYIAAFQTPVATLPWRFGLSARWSVLMARGERAATDDRWPGPGLVRDASNGVKLYKANLSPRARRPELTVTDVPVQILIALKDSYVTPAVVRSADGSATDLRYEEIDGGHWLPRSRPDEAADAIAGFVEFTESG